MDYICYTDDESSVSDSDELPSGNRKRTVRFSVHCNGNGYGRRLCDFAGKLAGVMGRVSCNISGNLCNSRNLCENGERHGFDGLRENSERRGFDGLREKIVKDVVLMG